LHWCQCSQHKVHCCDNLAITLRFDNKNKTRFNRVTSGSLSRSILNGTNGTRLGNTKDFNGLAQTLNRTLISHLTRSLEHIPDLLLPRQPIVIEPHLLQLSPLVMTASDSLRHKSIASLGHWQINPSRYGIQYRVPYSAKLTCRKLVIAPSFVPAIHHRAFPCRYVPCTTITQTSFCARIVQERHCHTRLNKDYTCHAPHMIIPSLCTYVASTER